MKQNSRKPRIRSSIYRVKGVILYRKLSTRPSLGCGEGKKINAKRLLCDSYIIVTALLRLAQL
jgi:hypothetical protein